MLTYDCVDVGEEEVEGKGVALITTNDDDNSDVEEAVVVVEGGEEEVILVDSSWLGDAEVGCTSDEVGDEVVTGVSDVVETSLSLEVDAGVETGVVVAVGVPLSEVIKTGSGDVETRP